jgi:UDP-N-acetylglucosamine transferase subunit ALG13
MIFVTVGGQLPFDRLIIHVDRWAQARGRTDVFAQVGRSAYQPIALQTCTSLPPQEFRARMRDASAIVAHAGIGSVLAALELGKPILIMPRRASLGEHRNDHQLATARALAARGQVRVAFDETQLAEALDALDTARGTGLDREPATTLIERIRSAVLGRS